MLRLPWKIPAENEYEKDSKLIREDVLKLKEWMESTDYLPAVDEEMICQFLHACFFDIERAKKTIDYFYTYKTTMPDFFDNWDPNSQDLQDTINNTMIAAPLPYTNADGYRIIVCKLNDTSADNFNYPACVRWILMSCMYSLWTNGIQPGYIIVYDATGYSMSHLLKCSLTNIRNYINYGKNASPIRVVKIVFINTSPVVKKLITIVKPFLSKELINMMSFHTSADSYFAEMSKEAVPEDYGGSAPPLLSLHRECVKNLVAAREWLMYEEKVRIDSLKKNGKMKKETAKVETSFKKLEID